MTNALRMGLALLALSSFACSGAESNAADADGVTQTSEDGITSAQKLSALRATLFAANGEQPWFQCSARSREGRVLVEITTAGTGPSGDLLHARARYGVVDYNGNTVETTADLGPAKLVSANDGTPGALHYMFSFVVGGATAMLDTGPVAGTAPASLAIGGLKTSLRCDSFDAPFSTR